MSNVFDDVGFDQADSEETNRLVAASPALAAQLKQVMRIIERPLPIKPGELEELQEAVKKLQFELHVARTRLFGQPTEGLIRIPNYRNIP